MQSRIYNNPSHLLINNGNKVQCERAREKKDKDSLSLIGIRSEIFLIGIRKSSVLDKILN